MRISHHEVETSQPISQLVLSFFFYRTCAQNIQRTSDITELDVSKRCKDLASFMESLLQEMKAPGIGKDGLLAADELRSFSVTISYVLVSPRHCYANYLRYDALRSGILPIKHYIYIVEILMCMCVCMTITCSRYVLLCNDTTWKMLVDDRLTLPSNLAVDVQYAFPSTYVCLCIVCR